MINELKAINDGLQGVQLLNTYARSELQLEDLSAFQEAFANLLENFDLLGTEASLTAMGMMSETSHQTISDPCVHCGKSTSLGSGLYINRVPALTDDADGYMCVVCQSAECESCKESVSEYNITDDGEFICEECDEKRTEINALKATATNGEK